jgi:hypothetical protein
MQIMKKLFPVLAIALSALVYTGCKQHNTTSPDSGGAIPVDQRNGDPSANGTGANTSGSSTNNTNNTNMNNDHSNNNGTVNTADSSLDKKQKQ